ncbi:hypothetical protein ABZP36_033036 [Zizania latifolia]
MTFPSVPQFIPFASTPMFIPMSPFLPSDTSFVSLVDPAVVVGPGSIFGIAVLASLPISAVVVPPPAVVPAPATETDVVVISSSNSEPGGDNHGGPDNEEDDPEESCHATTMDLTSRPRIAVVD